MFLFGTAFESTGFIYSNTEYYQFVGVIRISGTITMRLPLTSILMHIHSHSECFQESQFFLAQFQQLYQIAESQFVTLMKTPSYLYIMQ
jgi:hypothetical protein